MDPAMKQDKLGKYRISASFSSFICIAIIILSVLYGYKGAEPRPGHSPWWRLGSPEQKNFFWFSSNLLSVDPKGGTVIINWSLSVTSHTRLHEDEFAVNIFFDENHLLQYDGSPRTFANVNTSPSPYFRMYPGRKWVSPDTGSGHVNFQTRVILSPKGGATTYRYPFDIYTAHVTLYAQDADSNATVGLIVDSLGAIPGFSVQTEYISRVYSRVAERITISRGNTVKCYAIVLVLSVWVVTLIFLYSTCMSVICGYPQRLQTLGIPIATFFTVAQVRPTMPGSPDFGVMMDSVGFLPCLAVMAVCSSLNVGTMVLLDHTVERTSLGAALGQFWRTCRNRIQTLYNPTKRSDVELDGVSCVSYYNDIAITMEPHAHRVSNDSKLSDTPVDLL